MEKKLLAVLTVSGIILSAAFMIKDYTTARTIPDYKLKRGTYGQGEREEVLDYEISDGTKGNIALEIPEATYTAKESRKILTWIW